jgi:hypothetical protein
MNEKPAHTGTVGLMVGQLRDRKEHLEKELDLLNVALAALTKAWSIDACLAKDDAIVNEMAREALTQRQPPQALPPRHGTAPELRDLSYSEAVARLLARVQDRREVSTRTLIMRLAVEGKKVQGKDPYRTLYRTLLKDERFIRVNGKWALAEWYPPDSQPYKTVGERLAFEENQQKKEHVN